MTINKNDVVIIGGGLIGLCLAYFLGKMPLSVSIIDKDEIIDSKTHKKDFRTTAISEGTKNILENFGIWQKIKRKAEPIKVIKVFDRSKVNNLTFLNPNNNSFLGYIVENGFLKRILLNELISNKKIRLSGNIKINNIQYLDNSILVDSKYNKFSTSLLVAADGKKGSVRKILKQTFFSKEYNQSALVANISHTENHNNTAYEIFYNSGPLATLPMLGDKNYKNQSSLVWTHNKKFIKSLYDINDNFLSSLINERTEKILGRVIKIINKQVFSLNAHINSSFINNRVVFVGDAAHSIHPIAGQGWNLGMRDVNVLTNIISEAKMLGIDLGSTFVCNQYQNRRYFDAFSLYQITDKLNSFFMFEGFIPKGFRRTGFKLIDSNNNFNKFITNYAMGNKS